MSANLGAAPGAAWAGAAGFASAAGLAGAAAAGAVVAAGAAGLAASAGLAGSAGFDGAAGADEQAAFSATAAPSRTEVRKKARRPTRCCGTSSFMSESPNLTGGLADREAAASLDAPSPPGRRKLTWFRVGAA